MSTKLYSYSTRGYPAEFTLVTDTKGVRPADGCDILIRNKAGHINSAKSENYYPSKEQALAAFVERQNWYIAQSRERLQRELEALENATGITGNTVSPLDGLEFSACIKHFGVGDENPYVKAARENYHVDGEIEIDDRAVLSGSGDGGEYVSAWVWVSDEQITREPIASK